LFALSRKNTFRVVGAGFQPLLDYMPSNMGRCPMLAWHHAFGAVKCGFETSLNSRRKTFLDCAGKISHEIAVELAESEYEKFHHKQIAQADQAGNDFDKAIKQLPPLPKRKKGGKK